MSSFTVKPYLDEPWAKRLRLTKSRSVKDAQGRQHSAQLPSPKPTHPSSTDNIIFSSSSAELQPKEQLKRLQSFRERLIPLPKKPAPVPAKGNGNGRIVKTKPASKPSVAPFFRRIEAAFQGQQQEPTASKATHAVAKAQNPPRSPSPDQDDLIQQLREHYLTTATSLHAYATSRLTQTHADLGRALTQRLKQPDEAFLVQAEKQRARLAQPLATFRIRSLQRRRGGESGAGEGGGGGGEREREREKEDSVGELVARAEEQVRGFAEDVEGLWAKWRAAEEEVKGLVRGVVDGSSSGGEGGVVAGGRDGYEEGEEVLWRFGQAIEKEIDEAEAEVVALGEEAVAVMREIEKEFRKATLPDLHTFFQSIDEP